jgi:hypothetical protein
MILFVVAVQPGFAGDQTQVQGLWKLVSYEVEIQATGQKEYPMGRKPTGYVIFTPEGRIFFILTAEGRKPAKTVQDRADLLNSIIAYSGTYRIEKGSWIARVEVAWNPEWIDTEQKRLFKVDGDQLQVFTPWRVMPNWAEKGMTRSIVTFQRAK